MWENWIEKRQSSRQILAQNRHSGPDMKLNEADVKIPIVLQGFWQYILKNIKGSEAQR